jgi:hydrogenase maturation factor
METRKEQGVLTVLRRGVPIIRGATKVIRQTRPMGIGAAGAGVGKGAGQAALRGVLGGV